ncbi:MFS transporter [Prolixibacteraceae bacterium JC049]|nr:MFS transporter [Prolixibacteraceae bacterium JC049]
MNQKIELKKILPVFMSFVVMGFVDIVGVSTGYVKKDFQLSDSLAQLVPAMAFVWFFLLSVPAGILQDRFGKRKILNIGMALTGLGMLIPFIHHSFPVMLSAFALIGIGNTIVQVSANPLLYDVTPKEKFSSFMSLTQFVKAIISLLGPIITTFFAAQMGNWKLIFVVYAITSFLAVLWLYATPIQEQKGDKKPASFASCFKLLTNPFVGIMVLGIFLTVGADVGMNSSIQTYLSTRFVVTLEAASLGISIYFSSLMISRFLGAIMLNWIKPRLFLIGTALVALSGIVLMFFAPEQWMANVAIFLVGLGSGNLFPLIFSLTVDKMPDRINEISGLMIMAVSGGAFIPLLIGYCTTTMGINGGLMILGGCILYVLSIALVNRR